MSSFPQMIFELLDDCIEDEDKENPKLFPVLLYTDNGDLEVTFEIQETNKYKVLAHLSLRMRKGNDAKVDFTKTSKERECHENFDTNPDISSFLGKDLL